MRGLETKLRERGPKFSPRFMGCETAPDATASPLEMNEIDLVYNVPDEIYHLRNYFRIPIIPRKRRRARRTRGSWSSRG
jgi:hypothetical protein